MGGLDEFTSLLTLHLESNCIEKIQGLSSLKSLRKLFMSGNSLQDLGVELIELSLDVLDVSSNPRLRSLDGLPYTLTSLNASGCPRLEGISVVSSIKASCPYLDSLDLSRTGIPLSSFDDLLKMTSLKVVYLQGTPLASTATDYRRLIVSNLPKLTYLDDSAVDELERAGAEAWKRGGKEAEKEARLAFRSEAKAQQRASMKQFALERAQRKIMRELNTSAMGREMSEDEMRAMIDRASAGLVEKESLKCSDQATTEALMASLSTCIVEGEAECLVCSEAIDSGSKAIGLPCSHIFHDNCIRTWFSAKAVRSCPTCRAQLDNPPQISVSPTERQPVTTKRLVESLAASLGISGLSAAGNKVSKGEKNGKGHEQEERSSAPDPLSENPASGSSSSSTSVPYTAKIKPYIADRTSVPNLSAWDSLKLERRGLSNKK